MGDGRTAPDKRIRRFVENLSLRLDRLDGSATSAADTARSKFGVVLDEAGIKRRSPGRLVALMDALVEAGIYVDADLTDMRLPLSANLRFSRRVLDPPKVHKALFDSEYATERFLATNFARIPGLDRLKLIKTQFELPGGLLIDLLCAHRDSGDLVVVEVKKAAPDRGIVTQTLSYVQALAATPYANGKTVRGLIITGLPDETLQDYALRLARDVGHDLTWLVYKVSISLEEVATTIPPREWKPGDWVDVQSDYGIVNPQAPGLASAMRAAGRDRGNTP